MGPASSTGSAGGPSAMHGFVASLSVIVVSELGDKTFFIAAIMAMRHPRLVVFTGALLALVVMTVASLLLGSVFFGSPTTRGVHGPTRGVHGPTRGVHEQRLSVARGTGARVPWKRCDLNKKKEHIWSPVSDSRNTCPAIELSALHVVAVNWNAYRWCLFCLFFLHFRPIRSKGVLRTRRMSNITEFWFFVEFIVAVFFHLRRFCRRCSAGWRSSSRASTRTTCRRPCSPSSACACSKRAWPCRPTKAKMSSRLVQPLVFVT